VVVEGVTTGSGVVIETAGMGTVGRAGSIGAVVGNVDCGVAEEVLCAGCTTGIGAAIEASGIVVDVS
jgi:hypothetical protein